MSAHHHGRWLAGLAAAVVLSAGALVLHERTASPPVHVAAAHAVLHTYTTSRGQRAEVELADGTHVILAPETTLRTFGDTSGGANSFGAVGSRDVALDGEAYFDVVHDAAHPFTVRTPSGIAQDLGTKFVVSSYPEVKGMQVAVQSGAVAVHRGDGATDSASRAAGSVPLVTLLHGDVARLDAGGTIMLARGVDVAKYIAWTRGSLVFDGTALRDVARALSRWYDLDITLSSDAIADRLLSLTIDSESPNAALKLVALSLDLGFERHGQRVILHPLVGAPKGGSDNHTPHTAPGA
jgi:ferric-dicitrate binding protein FerR (iron transport regulator)